VKPKQGPLIVKESVPGGVLRQLLLPGRGEEGINVRGFSGLKRKAGNEEEQQENRA
jgi:hypothetical protein